MDKLREAMKSVDLQTLQCLAAVRVAISVCETQDLQRMIGRFRKNTSNEGIGAFSDLEWRQVSDEVTRRLKLIPVPGKHIEKILENLWPISFEISKWILYHDEDIDIDCSPNFCWTQQTSIDYVKTAKSLVENEMLDTQKRFKLACIYCFDSEVRSLWDRLSLSEKRSFFVRRQSIRSKHNRIIIYWSYYLQEVSLSHWGMRQLDNVYLYEYSVQKGYLSAAKYFFHKFDERFRKRVISDSKHSFNYIRYNYKSECIVRDQLAIAFFLVCETFKYPQTLYYITYFFLYFLEWPMQKHFIQIVNWISCHIRPEWYGEILKRIFEKDMRGFKDYDYKKLFMEIWRMKSQEKGQTYVTESEIGMRIFMTFVTAHFGFLFEEKSFALKAEFIEILSQMEISGNAVEKKNVEFLKFLVRERVTNESILDNISLTPPLQEFGISFASLRLGDVVLLIDRIRGYSLQPQP